MVGDFPTIFYWWVLLFGLGVVFLPLTLRLFPKFFDRGYAFSKIIGILVVSYVVWLLGCLKILQFVPEAILLIVLGFILLNYFVPKHHNDSFKNLLKKHWKVFLFEELLFLLCLIIWSFVRGFQPDIHGAEKFMDFSFLNSILRSQYFPPQDAWFAGKSINYYYFGHLVTAVLTKLSGLPSNLTYNLMIATIFALAFTATFSLGGNLMYKNLKSQISMAAGLLSAFLLTLSGNLHTLYWFIKNGSLKGYWYYDAIRFIGEQFGAADNTINEFPSFSFIFADLHGHMINIPTVLLILALLLHFKPKLSQFAMLALCFATTFMTNPWDFPIYLLVAGLVVWWGPAPPQYHSVRDRRWVQGKDLLEGVKRAIAICGVLIAASVLLNLPFHLNFQNIAQGVALTDFHSPPWMLSVLWGFPLFITVSYFVFRRNVAAEFYSAPNKGTSKMCSYTVVLLVVGWFLILVPEIIYIKDIYIHSYQRANTMFKLTYQSFIMFSLAGGYIIVKTLSNLKQKLSHFLYVVVCSVLLIFVFIYPYFAVKSYYGLRTYRGLDGLQWLEQQYPDDFEAVNWLKENVKNQPVILEAVGESYTDFARVSANTGLPTVCGWTVHEWLWRGSYDEPGKRDGEVRKMYESANLEETKGLLSKYKVEYIYVGSLEKQKYTGLDEEKFARMGEVVFENEGTKIYHLPKSFD